MRTLLVYHEVKHRTENVILLNLIRHVCETIVHFPKNYCADRLRGYGILGIGS